MFRAIASTIFASWIFATAPATASTVRYVFDCYATNFAWGYSLSGFYVDDQGFIYEYQRTGSPWLPVTAPEGHYPAYTLAELTDKFRDAHRINRVDAVILRQKTALIDAARKGPIERITVGADQGNQTCVAYVKSPTSENIIAVVLRSTGDTKQKNTAPEAIELARWLATLTQQSDSSVGRSNQK